MKARHFLFALLFFLGGLGPVRATVLIYGGTFHRFEIRTAAVKNSGKCFVVIDPTANQMFVLTYGRIGGAKHRDVGDIITIFSLVAAPNTGRIVCTFSRAAAPVVNNIPIGNEATFFRGTQSTVIIRINAGVATTAAQPLTLTGTYRIAAGAFFARYEEDSYAARYDQTRSVIANLGDKTLTETRDDLVAYLDSLGYTL